MGHFFLEDWYMKLATSSFAQMQVPTQTKLESPLRPGCLHYIINWNEKVVDTDNAVLNGWQLAKMKKSIPDMSLP